MDDSVGGKTYDAALRRIAQLEAEVLASHHAEENAFRNRDSAVAENERLKDALHSAQYEIGELGRSWSATTISYDCQKIQRKIKAVYDRYGSVASDLSEHGK